VSPAEEVQAAADALVDAFARSDADAYFGCFAPDATFVFHTTDHRLESRREYEQLWARWVAEDDFRVLSCTSSAARVQVLGDAAVFSHDVHTVVASTSGQEESVERETIVFVRAGNGWTAVHEHLSAAPAHG
jgi:uncharacterized protein (TIGR02246 family)